MPNAQTMVIASLVILALIGVFFFSGVMQDITGTGFQGFTVGPGGISLTNFLKPGQAESSAEWVVPITMNGYGQSLAGTFDKSTLSSSGYTSRYPVSITGFMSEQKAYYIINPASQEDRVGRLEITSNVGTAACSALGCTVTTFPAGCPADTTWTIRETIKTGFLGWGGDVTLVNFCVKQVDVGLKSTMNPVPNVDTKVDFTVNNGKDAAETISLSWREPSKTTADGKVTAQWISFPLDASSLGTISVGSNYYVLSMFNGQSWKPIEKNTWDGTSGYVTTYQTAKGKLDIWKSGGLSSSDFSTCENNLKTDIGNQNCFLGCSFTPTSVVTCSQEIMRQTAVTPVNAVVDRMTNSNIQIVAGKTTSSGKTTDGKDALVVNLGALSVAHPVLNLRFRGDYIGVVIPQGKPRIVTPISPVSFNSGQEGTVVVNVANDGTSQGVFTGGINTDCGVAQKNPSNIAYVNSGQTGVINIPLITKGATTFSGSCTVTVTDVNGGGQSTAPVSINMLKPVECTNEGEISYPGYGQVLKICTNGKLVDYKSCQYGVVFENNKYDCGKNPGNCTIEGLAPTADSPCCAGLNLINGLCHPNVNETCPIGQVTCQGQCIAADSPCPPTPGIDLTVIVLVLIVILAGLLGYALNNRDPVWLGIGLVVGTIAALIIWIVIQFVLKNWLLIVLGGAVGAAGLWIFYAIGGFAIVAGVMAFVRKK